MGVEQGKSEQICIKPVFPSDDFERRGVGDLVALVRHDLMAGGTLVLGDIPSVIDVCANRCKRAESRGNRNPAKSSHATLTLNGPYSRGPNASRR
jgi:hypothetical protein